MRLVLAAERFPAPSETFIVAKVLALLERGHDVHVVCRFSDAEAWDVYGSLRDRHDVRARVHVSRVGKDVTNVIEAVKRLGGLAERGVPAISRYVRDAARQVGWRKVVRHTVLESWFIALRPDLVHFEFGNQAVQHMHLKPLLGCPFTVSFRGFDLNYVGLSHPGFYDGVWAAADRVHFLGEDLRRRAAARGCPPTMPHVLIPPALDDSDYSPPERGEEPIGTPDRPLRTLSVGRLHWKKGHDHALAAIGILVEQGLTVEHRIAGSGPAEQELRETAAAIGIEQAVRFLGHVTREHVTDELRRADVFVHAAVSEGFANSVLEAQAMALPVVCTDADGLRDNVVADVTAFVVDRRDPAALAERVAALANDGATRRTMGAAGRARVVRDFRLEDQVDAWVSFYEEVVRRATVPARDR